MHLVFLVEDVSGERLLRHLIPQILDEEHTFEFHHYKGVGTLPKNLKPGDARKRILLDQLPKLLRGLGKTFASYPDDYGAAVVTVCDLDDKCPVEFKAELIELLANCDPAPLARFVFAIEECEAWILGDHAALREAYPNVRMSVVEAYDQDSICGTWEVLADAVYPGGHLALKRKAWYEIGKQKSLWADEAGSKMKIDQNISPSLAYLVETLADLTAT